MSFSSFIRSRADLLAYVPLAVATTAADVLGRDRTHAATKVALAPTLAAGVLATRSQRCPKRTGALLAALVGSTVGDWFMYRSSRTEGDSSRAHMRLGASAFGVQQVGLVGLLLHDGARPQPVPSAVAATTLAGLAVLDSDGGAPDPVLTGYGLLLGSMSALAMGDGKRPRHGRAVALGGALFLVSDAAIIVGQQYAKTPRAQAISSVVILSTYTAALGLLVHGLRDEG
ncbi:lysoplasmalogenase family protein [Janibacter sp. YB324]|uniref:lysoplasmalogenase family protein n=1 Tax=Janibacter sp. YB324 TaxID=2761047 RepID=UPI0016293CA2|nr:lysoplasmalogenase family protein [Janibacter sp. YB324]QNF93159.1 lysoplasmalogenase [Janibacter sp. YB324]